MEEHMIVPDFSVEGKVVIVTGASRGIGNTLARGFAEAGAAVALAARKVSELESTAEDIRAQGGTALVVPTDVTNDAQITQMIQKTVQELGRIDVLINNVGARQSKPPLEVTEDLFTKLIDRNLKSVHLCSQAAARVMIEQRSGSIINISAMSGVRPVAQESHAGAAKAAVNHLTRVLAAAWAPYNVRVNAIAPSLTLTAQAEAGLGPELIAKYTKDIPLGRAARPEDYLGVTIFLASEASSFITGVVIPVDGGPR